MRNSMSYIKVLGHVSENHTLSAHVPESVAAGPVEVLVAVPLAVEDDDENAWMQGIAHELWAELADERGYLHAEGWRASRCRRVISISRDSRLETRPA